MGIGAVEAGTWACGSSVLGLLRGGVLSRRGRVVIYLTYFRASF